MSRHVIIDGVRYVPDVAKERLHNEAPGDYCRRMRTQMGLSLTQVAERADCAFQTISDFENRARATRVDIVVRIAQALNLSLDRMFGLPGAGGAA